MIDILRQDCIHYLQDCGREFDFIFADPPFNIDHHYNGFDDNMDWFEYQEWTIDWIVNCWEQLKDGGAMVIHGSIKLRPIFWEAIIELGLSRNFETETVWHYRFGVNNRSNWVDGHCPEIVLRKEGERKWYPDNVLIPSDRASVYKDPRVNDHERGGTKVPNTVWGVPSDGKYWGRVQGNSKERRPYHPNQLPVRLMQRHIMAYTQTGDDVFDPFCGSGTTAFVCHHEGRNCATTDLSAGNVASAADRIKNGFYREWE